MTDRAILKSGKEIIVLADHTKVWPGRHRPAGAAGSHPYHRHRPTDAPGLPGSRTGVRPAGCTCVGSPMELTAFRPQSKLVTRVTPVEKPRFPAFDAHNHLGEVFGGGWDHKPLSELLDLL